MIQLLTATGARPEAFALCERWMARQDYVGEVVWIVVDDGPQPTRINKSPKGWLQVVIRPAPHWQPGQNTQARNLLKGLEVVDCARPLVIIEDDDWYAPDWLSTVVGQLGSNDLVGEGRARYYNVSSRRFQQLPNSSHSSLCSTAMQGSAINIFKHACNSGQKFIDLRLWRNGRLRKKLFGGHRVVGLKGLPGRGGIGMGHREEFGSPDDGGSKLREWIGEDAEAFL